MGQEPDSCLRFPTHHSRLRHFVTPGFVGPYLVSGRKRLFFGQMLDGLEVMQRKNAHRLLFQHLAGKAPEAQLREMEARVERQLGLPEVDREGTLESLFSDLASFTAQALLR